MHHLTLLLAALLLVVGGGTAAAEPPSADEELETDPPPTRPPAQPPRRGGGVSLGFGFHSSLAGDLAGGDVGSISSVRLTGTLGAFLMADQVIITPAASFGWQRYGSRDALQRNGSGVPLGDFYSLRLGVNAIVPVAGDIRLVVGANVNSGFEDRASVFQSLVVGGLVVATFQLSKEFKLSAGLVVSSSRGWPVIPAVGFEWDVTDDLEIGIVRRAFRVAWRLPVSLGTSSRTGQPVKPVFLDFECTMDSARYRLGANAAVRDGELVDRSGLLGIGIRFQPAPPINFRLFVAMSFYSELRINNSDNDTVESYIRKPHPYILLEARMVF